MEKKKKKNFRSLQNFARFILGQVSASYLIASSFLLPLIGQAEATVELVAFRVGTYRQGSGRCDSFTSRPACQRAQGSFCRQLHAAAGGLLCQFDMHLPSLDSRLELHSLVSIPSSMGPTRAPLPSTSLSPVSTDFCSPSVNFIFATSFWMCKTVSITEPDRLSSPS